MPAVPLLPPVAVVPVLPPLLLLPPVAVVPVSLLLLLLPQPNEAERRQTMTNMPSFFMYSPSPYERATPKWTFMTRKHGTAFQVRGCRKKSAGIASVWEALSPCFIDASDVVAV